MTKTTKIYWARFSEGNLYEEAVNDMWGNEAKKRFEDVRKVKIVEVK